MFADFSRLERAKECQYQEATTELEMANAQIMELKKAITR